MGSSGSISALEASLPGLASRSGRGNTAVGVDSGVLCTRPLTLLAAVDDGGRALLLSATDGIEFCCAREEAGRGALVGAGDARGADLGSDGAPSKGDEAADGDMPFLRSRF